MSIIREVPIQEVLAEPVAELTDAEFIALAERDRDAAIALMWPNPEEQAVMKLLDAVAFDGFIESLKEKLAEQSLSKAD